MCSSKPIENEEKSGNSNKVMRFNKVKISGRLIENFSLLADTDNYRLLLGPHILSIVTSRELASVSSCLVVELG